MVLVGLVLLAVVGGLTWLAVTAWRSRRASRPRGVVEEAREAGRLDVLEGYLAWAQDKPVQVRNLWDRLSPDLRAEIVLILAPYRQTRFDARATLISGQYLLSGSEEVRLAYLDGADAAAEEIAQVTIGARLGFDAADRQGARITQSIAALRELDPETARRDWEDSFKD